MARIFISYRHRDSAYVTASLSEKLQQRFGRDSVFYDIDTIPLGVDFREHIGNAVGQCGVLLAIIGEEWITAVDKTGKRRLDNPGDYVRVEIESALNRKIPVVPVLVDEAQMPAAEDLPETIRPIVYRNAAEIRAGSDLWQHIERLIYGLEKLFQSSEKTKPETTKKEIVQKPDAPAKKERKPSPRELKPIASAAPTPLQPETKKPQKKPTRKKLKPETVLNRIKGNFVDGHLFLKPSIPKEKLNNAIIAYAPGVSGESVLLLFDNTTFGSAKDGLLITSAGVYWRNSIFYSGSALFSGIKTVSFSLGTFTSDIYVNGQFINIGNGDDHKKMAITLADMILNLSPSAQGNLPKGAERRLFVTSVDGACRISLPNDWSKQTNNTVGKLAAESPNKDISMIVVHELKTNFPASTTLDNYVSIICNLMKPDLTNPSFSKPVSTIVSGFSARQFEVVAIVIEIKWKFLCTMIETPQGFYQIVFTVSVEKYNEAKAELLDIINSFQEIS